MSPELLVELTAEAKAFGKYLLGVEVNARAVTLYLAAHDQTQFESVFYLQNLVAFAFELIAEDDTHHDADETHHQAAEQGRPETVHGETDAK